MGGIGKEIDRYDDENLSISNEISYKATSKGIQSRYKSITAPFHYA